MKQKFDYTELKCAIVRKYGNASNFCKETGMFSKQQLSMKLNNGTPFSQTDALGMIKALDINTRDVVKFFLTPQK